MSTTEDAHQEFLATVLPYARQASQSADVPVSVILAQWAHETGWGTSRAFREDHNLAGLMRAGKPRHFDSLAAAASFYANTLLKKPYDEVRAAITPEDTIAKLGASSYYTAGVDVDPGGRILALWKSQNLKTYDRYSGKLSGGRVGPMPQEGLPSSDEPIGAGVGFNPLNAIGDFVSFFTGGGLRKVLLGGVFVAGGTGLIVAGVWRGFVPAETREKIRSSAVSAAKVAAL